MSVRKVIASAFADAADVEAFNRCKALGNSDTECFNVGDNGIGCWGDLTSSVITPMVALPPEDMEERWGSIENAKHRHVLVSHQGFNVVCLLADRMPHRSKIKNKAGIDLNPAACEQLHVPRGAMVKVEWDWVEKADKA